MTNRDEVFTGEYFVSLKGSYKIPLKCFDANNPPPPGTEDDTIANNTVINTSPLAIAKRTTQPPDQVSPTRPVPPKPSAISQPSKSAAETTSSQPTKRSSLFMMPSAEGLPEELIKLFKPLCCDLCVAKLNSPSTARLHYMSKNHEKKINNWLAAWSERTGEPLPKRQAMNKGPTGPNALHCDVCDIPLTSLQHANQHNMGRKHKNALAGRNKPSGPGYYDANNKWVRTPKIEEDPTGRFHIGEAFLKNENNTETVIVPESVLKSPPPPPPPPPVEPSTCSPTKLSKNYNETEANPIFSANKSVANNLPLSKPMQVDKTKEIEPKIPQVAAAADLGKYCQICDISVPTEMHMRLHLAGAKHTKKLRNLCEMPLNEAPATLSQCIMDDAKMKRPKQAAESGGQDYSVFRTPSGQYYCQVCDLSVKSEITLAQHFASKRHMTTAKRK